MNELLSLRDAANELSVNVSTIRKWMRRGLVSVVRVGPRQLDILRRDRRSVKISRDELNRLTQNYPADA